MIQHDSDGSGTLYLPRTLIIDHQDIQSQESHQCQNSAKDLSLLSDHSLIQEIISPRHKLLGLHEEPDQKSPDQHANLQSQILSSLPHQPYPLHRINEQFGFRRRIGNDSAHDLLIPPLDIPSNVDAIHTPSLRNISDNE